MNDPATFTCEQRAARRAALVLALLGVLSLADLVWHLAHGAGSLRVVVPVLPQVWFFGLAAIALRHGRRPILDDERRERSARRGAGFVVGLTSMVVLVPLAVSMAPLGAVRYRNHWCDACHSEVDCTVTTNYWGMILNVQATARFDALAGPARVSWVTCRHPGLLGSNEGD